MGETGPMTDGTSAPEPGDRRDTLTVIDNRTGRSQELAIEAGTIRAADLRRIKVSDDDPGLLTYDPAFTATASCRSAITFIDGDKGILRYRGYPIDELAERSSFLEVCYLLMNGELPTTPQLEEFTHLVKWHTFVHENVKNFTDPVNRRLQMARLIAKMPTLAAFASRHSRGLPYVYPDNTLGFPGNLLNMMWKMSEPRYEPDPVLEHALDVLMILHADHEQNCSTNAMRAVGSSRVDPYSAAAAAVAALYGPLHGGANEQVLRMLREIGSVDNIRSYVDRVKRGEFRLMGFGHRVYKNYDPRAKVVRRVAEDVFKVTGL